MRFWTVFDRIIDILAFLAGILVIFAMLAVCTDVSLRFFWNYPIVWVYEITELSLLFIAFLGTTWLLKKGGHVRVDIILVRVSQRTQELLGMVSSIIGILICLVLVWYGIQVSWQFTAEGISDPTILELPKGPILIIIPLGSFLLLIQFLRSIHGYWRKWQTS